MSTRTIEPIHIVLPDADGGYYRFGELPRLIAEALKPDTEEADADPHGDYYVFRALDQMNYEKDLPQAAALPPGAPGYLHVVENSASKRPLEWRMGAVLNAGLVHLDWLNEWGESRKPPLVFSTVSAPEPQAATPAPTAPNYAMLATPDQLIAAFGSMSDMDSGWFRSMKDRPALKEAVVITGVKGRHGAPPMLDVFKVLQYLLSPKRQGKTLLPETGWRLLKGHFPNVYAVHEACDPNATD